MCDALVDEVLINDDRACNDCGHLWTPDEEPSMSETPAWVPGQAPAAA